MTFMVLLGCTESFDQKTSTFEKLFTVVPASVSGVYFQNTIDQNLEFNALIFLIIPFLPKGTSKT